MRQMKDSGIEWIGDIPQEWILKKIKNATEFISSGTTPASNNINYYDGNVYWIQSGDIYGKSVIEDTAVKVTELALRIPSLTLYFAPYIVMAMYGGSIGNIAISLIDACTNQACCCIKNDKKNDLHFMYYWLDMCKDVFLLQAEGGGQPNISQTKIKNQYYVQPPLSEQEKIAAHLDHKCSEIDALATDIQNEIETLGEYKRSVITEAVTKGLNPDVEMKDSGIEFIGDIPKHWKIRRIKTLGEVRNGLTYTPQDLCDSENGILVLRSSNVQNGKITLDDNVYVSCPVKSDLMVKNWDILICSRNGSRELIGKNAIIQDLTATFGAFMMIFRTRYPKYLYYILNSDVFRYYLGTFFTSTINQLTGSNFGNMKVAFCPIIEEQQQIAEYLDNKCYEIDGIIKEKQQQLETLAEYKKSLIYEYVTGKKEVVL